MDDDDLNLDPTPELAERLWAEVLNDAFENAEPDEFVRLFIKGLDEDPGAAIESES